MLRDIPRPVIFAHRGASAHAPENTLASFELALAHRADAIELDAKLTADGEVVVFHDPTLDRTTDGTGRLAEKNLADLRSLDAGSFFSGRFRGERIPLLSEVLEAIGRKMYINIELTNYATPRDQLVENVCALVKRQGLEGRVLFSSFLAGNLRKAARLLPGVPRGLLALRGWMGAWARSFGFSFGEYAALHPFFTDVDAPEVGRVHRLGRRIHVWTVNNPQDMTNLNAWGADGIFTDDPRLALRLTGRQA